MMESDEEIIVEAIAQVRKKYGLSADEMNYPNELVWLITLLHKIQENKNSMKRKNLHPL